MTGTQYKVHIIGAGVSGLIAAYVLEQKGFSPVIIEATERVGGRVKTDAVNGYQLDHGFQVLLTGYPAAQKYLDFDALELQKFLPGASIFKNKVQKVIGDPLREKSFLFSTLFSGIGSLSDKLKILKLNRQLKHKTVSEIFSAQEKTTMKYLEDFGFSKEMIHDFFTPFFSGIFLEHKLETSSRMFEFIYKMFGEGYASVPKAGMEAIPKQLQNKLQRTTFKFNTKASAITDGEIVLENGTKLTSDFTIVATDASFLVPALKTFPMKWNDCHTFYFEVQKRNISKPLIGLIPADGTVINNIFYHTSVATSSLPKNELLSVTVVDHHNLSDENLLIRVKRELKTYCGIDTLALVKQVTIPKALPKRTNLKYEMQPLKSQVSPHVFLAGDTQLNGSLNAAMISGERAAMRVIQSVETAS